ncbi:1-acyl-sn-glycerol-3-phosphate acyltransferase [Deinococcus aetherius]|uniref:1-acyl-sn-glycerol-3-phosphate acyltransferase n=1 Tax=Deinococcus aetherius TaxID=200252 RepID=A0ABM8AGZ7_9DEIO|nr:lysophospholipid acyltransferase family protein [Deinococcus aetherius]BDP43077.1 1-acyl-sn-glycerol-3-phosphate acyltransferase [Deinococcus aetherius]
MSFDWVAALLQTNIRRSVHTDLRGVWVRGPLPQGGAVLAPNHHSWWDGYVLREVTWVLGLDFRVLMAEEQLARFPFLRRLGALGTRDLREAVRAAREGAWVVIFPEGTLHPAGPPRGVQPGAAWIARTAGVPLVPVALRVTLRGAQHPEAYLRFGRGVEGTDLGNALTRELAALDAELRESGPEAPLAGYLRLSGGRTSAQERLNLPGRVLARITGER